MVDYLAVREGMYSTDQAEPIECLMQMQLGQESRRDPTRSRKYGKITTQVAKSSRRSSCVDMSQFA